MKNGFQTNMDQNEEDLELLRQAERDLADYKLDENDSQFAKSYRDDLSEYDNNLFKNDKHLEESLDFDNEAFKEWKKANEEMYSVLDRIDNEKIAKMKKAIDGKFMILDYENLEEKEIQLNNELIASEKLNQIKEIVNEKLNKNVDEPKFEDDGILIGKINLEERDRQLENQLRQSVQEMDKKVLKEVKNEVKVAPEKKEIDKRLERAREEGEKMNMEREDTRSMKYEEVTHKNKFVKRLFTLPDSFPNNKDNTSVHSDSGLKFWAPRFTLIKIDKPVEKPAENLVESTKAKLESKELNKIANKKRCFIKYQKIGQKEQKLLQDKNKIASSTSSTQNLANDLKRKNTQKIQRDAKIITKESFYVTHVLLKKVDKIVAEVTKFIFHPKLIEGLNALLTMNENLKSSKSFNFYSKGEDTAENQQLFIGDENQPKSLESLLIQIDQSELKNQTKLEIKMEKIQDLKGIEELKNLRFLYLSMNNIKEISNLVDVKQLVEINLAQNEIKSMKGISNLKNLRYLSLEVNQLTKIEGLNGCANLECLDLNNNQISVIENLSELKKLKKLLLFRNKIAKITGLENLIGLEELDLGRNSIVTLEGISNCVILRKLVLYYNQINKIPNNFTHLFLVEIWLNGNKLTDISSMTYFPSLEVLNLQENQLETIFKDACPFLPRLRKLNLSNNKIYSFAQIHKLLKKSPLLEELFCIENPFLTDITDSTESFYKESFSDSLPFLRDLNNHTFNSVKGYKEYLARKDLNLDYFSTVIRFLDEYYYIDKVASSKFNPSKASLNFQKNLAISKIISGPISFLKIKELISQQITTPFILKHDLTWELSKTEFKFKSSLQKIKSFLLKTVYKKRKIKKYYLKNLKKVVRIQGLVKGIIVRKIHDARSSFKKKKEYEAFLKLAPYAIKIQKVFRGFRTRQRKKKFFNNLKVVDDDLEFEADDINFFDQEPDLDRFNLKIPDNLDINQLIMPVRQPLKANQNDVYNKPPLPNHHNHHHNHHQSNDQKHHVHNLSPIKNAIEEKKEYEDDDDAYSVSSIKTGKSVSEIRLKNSIPVPPKKPVITTEERDKIAEDWGFKDKNSALFLKLQKERMQKEAKNKKAPNSQDRIAMFRANNMKGYK